VSILNVEHLTHGFGDRAIFDDVSFRLLKGEHIGLIGANGEGKSTFMNIITGKLMPDEGKIEWAKNVRVGYLDQHTVLKKGMTIRDVLTSAFDFLIDMETQMNDICAKMGDASAEELEIYMDELGTIQELLLPLDADLPQNDVPGIALQLFIGKRHQQPPPMKYRNSTLSPSRSTVVSCWAFMRNSSLTETVT